MGTGEKKRKGELERRIMYVALILYNQFSVISSTQTDATCTCTD